MKPITDKAEISIDFPDKAYVGAFGHNSTFDAQSDAEGIKVKLSRAGFRSCALIAPEALISAF